MIDIGHSVIDGHGIDLKNMLMFVSYANHMTNSSYAISLGETDYSDAGNSSSSAIHYRVDAYASAARDTTPVPVVLGNTDVFTIENPPAFADTAELIALCETHFVDVIIGGTSLVPKSVTRRQARQQLLVLGLLANVETLIGSIVDPVERGTMQIFWEDSNEFFRDNVQLNILATQLGMTQEDLDAAFIAAKLL